MQNHKCKLVSWSDIEKWTNGVVKKMLDSGFVPDVVIGLTRGGWVPARLICDHLGIKSLYAVKTEHWGITATRTGNAVLAQPLGVDITGKKVLVVDDITDTGQSLKLAIDHIKELGPNVVKSATLLHIDHSMIVPDYYHVHVPKEDWTWFVFPWNFNEDIRTLVKRVFDDSREGLGEKMVKSLLKKRFQISVRPTNIKIALSELQKNAVIKKANTKWMLAAK